MLLYGLVFLYQETDSKDDSAAAVCVHAITDLGDTTLALRIWEGRSVC